MSLETLIETYAEMNTMQRYDVIIAWNEGEIDKYDLMEAWLEYEGIIGYGYIFRKLFELMELL